jgi:hypothetical protein
MMHLDIEKPRLFRRELIPSPLLICAEVTDAGTGKASGTLTSAMSHCEAGDPLERLNGVVPWEMFRKPLSKAAQGPEENELIFSRWSKVRTALVTLSHVMLDIQPQSQADDRPQPSPRPLKRLMCSSYPVTAGEIYPPKMTTAGTPSAAQA